jgi:hypothetical protein
MWLAIASSANKGRARNKSLIYSGGYFFTGAMSRKDSGNKKYYLVKNNTLWMNF